MGQPSFCRTAAPPQPLAAKAGAKTRKRLSTGRNRGGILLVRDLLEPGDVHVFEMLLERDVHHAGRRSCAVPMLVAGTNPYRVAATNFPHRTPPGLNPADPGDAVERLSER